MNGISMDGLRRSLARNYNNLVGQLETELEKMDECDKWFIVEAILELRADIATLLACYDKRDMPEDWNMLYDEIKLESIDIEED